jgi:hypothetical protein
MRDDAKLDELRATLALDGYHLAVWDEPPKVVVSISAGPGICEDCLAPKPVLREMLAPVLDAPADRIDLRYPTDPGDGG